MLDDRLANLDARRQRRKKQDAREEVVLRLERDSDSSPTPIKVEISDARRREKEGKTNRTSSTFWRHAESIPLTTLGRTSSSPFCSRKPRSQSVLRTGRVGPTRSTSLDSSLRSSARA